MSSSKAIPSPRPERTPSQDDTITEDITRIYGHRNIASDDSLPDYYPKEVSLHDRAQHLAERIHAEGGELPILEHSEAFSFTRQSIVETYFEAIRTKKDEIIALFLESGLVTTETTDRNGHTPLLAAIEAGNTRTVQQLMDFDANVNAYGITVGLPIYNYTYRPSRTYRTPLQFAAEKGNLTIVKLLMETYHADDALIAPDGELALRLAAHNGHREVVQYLPSRRGGGWRRWKTKHSKAMKRVRKASRGIVAFFKVLLWYIPKFLAWDVPKECVFKPMRRGIKWLQEHWQEIPSIIADWVKRAYHRLLKIPKGVWKVTREIPSALKEIIKFVYKTITRIPKATKIVLLWLWSGTKVVGTALGRALGRLLSFVHTALTAVATFFRNLTLQDIADGLETLLYAIFIDVPVKLWGWISKFGDISYKVVKALFGGLGCCVWWIIRGLVELVIYVPKKLGVILAALANSLGSGCHEVAIWINPKRA